MRNDSLKYKANVFLSSMSAYEFINLLKLILIAKKKNLMWTNHGMLNIAHQWESEENIRQ